MKHVVTTVTIQSRVTPQLKRSAEAVFKSIGLSASDAIRVFLQQSVNTGTIPFPLVAKTPNKCTIAAMREMDKGNYEEFRDPEKLFKTWKNPGSC